jgi:hypothetical protein
MSTPALPPSLAIEAIIKRGVEDHRALVEALKLALRALNTAPRFRVGDTDSYKIAARIEAVLSEAKGGAP